MYTDEQLRAHIYDIQRFLRRIQQEVQSPQLLVPDGVYGSETAAAVRHFQRQNTLPVTGTVNYDTWTALYAQYNALTMCDTVPEQVSFFPLGAGATLRLEDKSPAVLVLQLMLNTAVPHFSGMQPITLTGEYGEETENTVKAAQKSFQLPQTGVVDRATWNALSLFHNSFYYRTSLPWLLAEQ